MDICTWIPLRKSCQCRCKSHSWLGAGGESFSNSRRGRRAGCRTWCWGCRPCKRAEPSCTFRFWPIRSRRSPPGAATAVWVETPSWRSPPSARALPVCKTAKWRPNLGILRSAQLQTLTCSENPSSGSQISGHIGDLAIKKSSWWSFSSFLLKIVYIWVSGRGLLSRGDEREVEKVPHFFERTDKINTYKN